MENTKLPCPIEGCESQHGFCYNTEKGTGFCHVCNGNAGKFRRDGLTEEGIAMLQDIIRGGNPEAYRTPEDAHNTAQAPNPQGKSLEGSYEPLRGISRTTMKIYGVYTYGDNYQEYIYPSGGIKTRFLKVKDFRARNLKTDEFFGQNLFNTGSYRTLIITEGELDALSAFQMMNNNPKRPQFAVVSLPSATPNKDIWVKNKEWLESFSKIVVATDNDEAGEKVAKTIQRLYPKAARRVVMDSFKDANEFLVGDAATDFVTAVNSAKTYTPSNVIATTEAFLDLLDSTKDHAFCATGIEEFDDLALGLMRNHVTLFKAATGQGKTELMRYLEYTLLTTNPDISIACTHLEETDLRSVLGLCSYQLQKNVTRLDLIEAHGLKEDVRGAISDLTKEGRYIQFGVADASTVADILAQIRWLSEARGVSFVFLEPIQDLLAGASDVESKEKMLSDLAVRLTTLAAELEIGIVVVGHTNDNGQIKYARTIEQRASVVVDLSRDQLAEDPDARNTLKMVITKNRPTGATGYAGSLKFNPETFTMKPVGDEY